MKPDPTRKICLWTAGISFLIVGGDTAFMMWRPSLFTDAMFLLASLFAVVGLSATLYFIAEAFHSMFIRRMRPAKGSDVFTPRDVMELQRIASLQSPDREYIGKP
jgi:hypothetical protein